MYNDLVKQVYANLRIDGENAVSYVNNTPVMISAQDFNEMFGMPNEGS